MMGDLYSNGTFGNYLIRGIAEIRIPDPVPWTPAAPGWMIVWAILSGIGIWILILLFLKWKQNAYRRQALKVLKVLKQKDFMAEKAVLCALPPLLKNTALKAFPKTRVAPLFGEKWISFLESRYLDPGFRGNAGKNLMVISYQNPKNWTITREQAEEIFSLVERWVRHHRREGES